MSWDTLFTEVELKLVAFIEVVEGVVSLKLAHVLAVLAATLVCEYLVGVATLVVVEKLHYDRLGRCDPLWVLLLWQHRVQGRYHGYRVAKVITR